MGVEIERKFLVVSNAWRRGAKGTAYRQGYLGLDPERTVRVRTAGAKGFLTIKGKSRGAARAEFEYPIPARDAKALLKLCLKSIVEKVRYRVRHAGKVWEVDEFRGASRGLVVAELELKSKRERFEKPSWLGREITRDHRYSNARLAARPYRSWRQPSEDIRPERISSTRA